MDTVAYRPQGRNSLLTIQRAGGDGVHLFNSCRTWFQVVFTRVT
jgi:hypothetical protein